MTDSEKSQINAYLEDYLQTLGINTSKNIMSCPICGDKDGFRFLPNSNKQYWKCFSGKHSSYPRDNGNIFEEPNGLYYNKDDLINNENKKK